MAQAQLSRLLPLPDDELKQVLEYAATLSKAEAADHFTNLLGDSAQVVEFISTFNSRRSDPKTHAAAPTPPATAPSSAPSSDIDAVPRQHRGKKKKAPLHTPAPRQVASFAVAPGTVYNKKDQLDDYVPRRPGPSTPSSAHSGPSRAPPVKSATPPPQISRAPPSAGGTLVSELGLPKAKSKSNPNSRASTPGPASRNNVNTTKISITGGVPMHGASTALSDLDQAIRSLEITTNPTHASNSAAGIAARRCNCLATKHPLLAATPNCLNCGKVICVKEGMGPCTFCDTPLLSSSEVQGMIKELRAERGREKMAADREAHRRADIAGMPRPFTKPRGEEASTAASKALEHRDRLLGFQAQNAQRTTIRDEASDFDAALAGSMWASPEERALALKKQQKLMREMEWNDLPEYEKRQQVVSIDLTGRKIFKKMVKIERPRSPDEPHSSLVLREMDGNKGHGGAFSKNPLLGALIRPVFEVDEKGAELKGRADKSTKWRRVQDDLEDNEAVVLDGGIFGAGDEPECG
ncbi:putative zinc finger motif, C2HC5-type-domain-containing protein [Lasiosphaeris hirsuta]|uniref:Zinc finger motif, C2HC5-type-domain-containing protein n=1 Tax=Lasiosphaeris hirsuta TaxID=260670 RepID=A0AA40AHK5_9PEZI|nr:putative zinc finger motif, C2HC5-type-domain-containing protein [Lasiosphaeris hirsuta]